MLTMAVTWSLSDNSAVHHVLMVLWITSQLVTPCGSKYTRPPQALCILHLARIGRVHLPQRGVISWPVGTNIYHYTLFGDIIIMSYNGIKVCTGSKVYCL